MVSQTKESATNPLLALPEDSSSQTPSIPSSPTSDSKPPKRKTTILGANSKFWKRSSSAAWTTAGLALAGLQDASSVAGIPWISMITAQGSQIYALIQGAQDNHTAYKDLALSACELAVVAGNFCQDLGAEDSDRRRKLSHDLQNHLNQLVQTLTDIKAFLESRTSRNVVQRVIASKADSAKVVQFRDKIRQAMDVFNLQSNIAVREKIDLIAMRQETLYKSLKLQQQPSEELPSTVNTHKETPESPTSGKATGFNERPTLHLDLDKPDTLVTSPVVTESPVGVLDSSTKAQSIPPMTPPVSYTAFSLTGATISGGNFNSISGNYSTVTNHYADSNPSRSVSTPIDDSRSNSGSYRPKRGRYSTTGHVTMS